MATPMALASSSSNFLSLPRTATHLSFSPKWPVLYPKPCFSISSLASPDLDPSLPSNVHTFWQWLRQEGMVSSKTHVKPAIFPEGLGLATTKDLSKNEVVLEVPKRFWINPDAVTDSEIGNACSGLKPWVSVALFLIRENLKDDSRWRRYLDILPPQTDSTVFWSEEELEELQGTQLLSTTLNVKEYVKSEFLKVEEQILRHHNDLFPSPVTLDDFFWAFGILRSRAFSRLRGQNLVLIPFADLVNHSVSVTSEEHACEVKAPAGLFSWDVLFSLRSPTSVKAGEQVFIQYDLKKSNAELALDYGFIEPKSDRNAYTLTFEIPESDPFFDDKLDIAETNGLGETAYFDIVLERPFPPAMLPFLRLLVLGGTDAYLLESLFRNSIWGNLEMPVSRANEELVCQMVRDVCEAALSAYHTTIEEDEKVKGENLDSRLRIAVGIREGEKRVLQQLIKIFHDRELELDELEFYQDRRLKDFGLCGEQSEIIFWESK
ncbi:ribulose-1,5 bisphosphate carboxylase/oxygenase large subunit N-methyltransferase, chloroplastic-like isoform X2 [Cucurbita maxima]|uniref:[fructose-bisphosphate aldolase]-lysine N-methyltransferase n=1 Tax=Cucurbita maxima TaxID=3661 RepID=A0A6J1I721_CUCMA|nr:ribulose-1,5 bisphosphate carboxylase/oxygenase large subunit N-methyltransferase, chloroplastic-like isoform X1 [Cucurbita maxima]XP_022972840.1 ribulose-1,5 bisphosphate carboxylase/oxygenase large subunit N-methyltransferase, chloroplastic-like isoform X1 [Cucurbita maxima]XP_022972841.1 ribulose-1,5 bisphosphate carboxylase/oxygenase large subunit N-methyltransferase, chloroplastic-like isoform X2 [Cucurbita maxima]